MLSEVNRESCTGCGACANVCSYDAIQMRSDEKTGFLYPSIDNEICVHCGRCAEICPVIAVSDKKISYESFMEESEKKNAYCALSNDEETRFNSTSGGLFTEFAKAILKKDGEVYGAGYDDNMIVRHFGINDEKDICKLRRSKYVQSDTGLCFREIEEKLKRGISVLFVGCPCQTSGLRAYLGKDYDNLFLVEFVCLGVNSPLVFKNWIDEIETENNKKVTDVWFKYKKEGWRKSPFCTRVDFSDATNRVYNIDDNDYMKGYLFGSYFLRDSCSQCRFVGFNRKSDIIFGDYWNSSVGQAAGASFAIINSDKGQKLFDRINGNIKWQKITINSIYDCNPRLLTPVSKNELSDQFFDDMHKHGFGKAIRKLLAEHREQSEIIMKILNEQ